MARHTCHTRGFRTDCSHQLYHHQALQAVAAASCINVCRRRCRHGRTTVAAWTSRRGPARCWALRRGAPAVAPPTWPPLAARTAAPTSLPLPAPAVRRLPALKPATLPLALPSAHSMHVPAATATAAPTGGCKLRSFQGFAGGAVVWLKSRVAPGPFG